jgi:hypothetical protein
MQYWCTGHTGICYMTGSVTDAARQSTFFNIIVRSTAFTLNACSDILPIELQETRHHRSRFWQAIREFRSPVIGPTVVRSKFIRTERRDGDRHILQKEGALCANPVTYVSVAVFYLNFSALLPIKRAAASDELAAAVTRKENFLCHSYKIPQFRNGGRSATKR